jgi:hypothetical protein
MPICHLPHTIDCQEDQPAGLHDLYEFVEVSKDTHDHLGLGELESWVICMRAVVDDAVHVEVEVVDLWRRIRRSDGHVEQRIALTEPAVKLGDSCARGARGRAPNVSCMQTQPHHHPHFRCGLHAQRTHCVFTGRLSGRPAQVSDSNIG